MAIKFNANVGPDGKVTPSHVDPATGEEFVNLRWPGTEESIPVYKRDLDPATWAEAQKNSWEMERDDKERANEQRVNERSARLADEFGNSLAKVPQSKDFYDTLNNLGGVLKSGGRLAMDDLGDTADMLGVAKQVVPPPDPGGPADFAPQAKPMVGPPAPPGVGGPGGIGLSASQTGGTRSLNLGAGPMNEKSIQGAMDARMMGAQEVADAAQRSADERKVAEAEKRKVLAEHAVRMETIQQTTAEKVAGLQKESDSLDKEMMKVEKIDPNRYWNNQHTAVKVLAVIGSALMGYGGKGGDALNMIKSLVDQDIDAQKEDIANKRHGQQMRSQGLARSMDRLEKLGLNQMQAQQLAKANALDVIDSKIADIESQQTADMAKANLSKLRGDLKMESLQLRQQAWESVSRVSIANEQLNLQKQELALKSQGTGAPTLSRKDVSKFRGVDTSHKVFSGIIKDIRELHKQHGTELIGQNASKMQQLREQLFIAAKDAGGLGAITGPDKGIVDKILGHDPTSFTNNLKGAVSGGHWDYTQSALDEMQAWADKQRNAAAQSYLVPVEELGGPAWSQTITPEQRAEYLKRVKLSPDDKDE